jgi:IS1 family transposase
VTAVDRATRYITRWAVVGERTWEGLQGVVEGAVPAQQYYSDAFPTSETLVSYPGRYAVAPGKSQTYSVEADTAAFRPSLARLCRTSRGVSRTIAALRRAVQLFVHAWTSRQLHKRAFPRYAGHVMDFVGPPW